jgi:ABC-type branched-subunit amino acid transport system substrate-binding protein
MRAAPQDTGQASAAVLQASNMGAKKIVVVATENSGSQLQKVAAEKAAAKLGMEVLLTLDIASTAPNYRAEINRIAGVSPDAVILFSQAQDGGTFVKQAAEAGQSWTIIGTTEWQGDAFPAAATMEAINQHKRVEISGFSHASGAAWDYYQPLYTTFAATREALKDIPAENSYNIQYYDILTLTALAIEKAGTTDANTWAPALRAVAMGPGTKCHGYLECLKLIRAGTAVDYSGVTGEMDYTDTGVVSGIYGIFKWTSLSSLESVTPLDGADVFDLEKQSTADLAARTDEAPPPT